MRKNRGKNRKLQETQKQDFDEISENAENGNKISGNVENGNKILGNAENGNKILGNAENRNMISGNAENGNENKNKVFSKVTIRQFKSKNKVSV